MKPPGSSQGRANGSHRPTWVRYQVLAAGCSVAVISYVHRVGFATASTEIKDDLGLTSADLGQLMTAFLIAYALFEIPAGLLGDRFGVRHLLTLLVLAWSLLTGLVTLVVWLPAAGAVRLAFLWVLRFLFGACQAGGFPSLARMMADWMPVQERATAQGLVWMSARLGGALVPLLLGTLFTFFGGWRMSLWALTGLGVLWCVAFWPWFRNRPEEMKQVNAAELDTILARRAGRTAGHGPLPWRTMLRSRSVWGLCLMYGFEGFSATFFITMLPDYLRSSRGLSAEQTRWLTSLPLACGVVACVVGGFVSDWFLRQGNRKWGRRLNGSVGLALAGAAVLSTIWVENVVALAALLCLTFFCNDLNMGPAWASCADIGERSAGTLGGAMNMTGNLFAALMAWVAGRLLVLGATPVGIGGWELPGRDLLFVIFAACFGAASLCWLLVDVTRPLGEPANRVA